MIRFKRIRWKNFLSTGNLFTEIQLDKSNTTLVIGENGAGKSTLLDALTFVLFNKPYRSVTLPQLVCSVNERDCVVEIEFEQGGGEYRVVRGQAPKTFEIWKDGILVDQDAKSRDYQKFLEESVLRMNYKSFCQVVILGSANYVPFMRLAAADRRAVVESILDIGVFSSMNSVLKERISATKEELQHASAALAVAKERTSLLKGMAEEERKRRKRDREWEARQVEDARREEAAARAEAETASKAISLLMESVSDEDEVMRRRESCMDVRRKLMARQETVEEEIEFYERNEVCPSCSRAIDSEFRANALAKGRDKASRIAEGLSEIVRRISVEEERIAEMERTMAEVRRLNAIVIRKGDEADSCARRAEEASRRPSEQTTVWKDLSDAVSAEEEAAETRAELVEEQHYLSLAATILKDAGIKAKIVRNYVPVINENINRYLKAMNLYVNFTLDEEFNETIRSRHRDEFTYSSFSEGEKRKIDLALLFAWRKIATMRNSVRTNLLILDEILDGSLDDGSTEAFLDVVGKQLDEGTNVFVISHKSKEVLQDRFSRTLQFTKRGNFSRMGVIR